MTNLREAAQMALEALGKLNKDGWILADFEDEVYASIEALRAALAQPEPEPVAWMYDWYDETEDIDGVPIGGIVNDCISKDYDEAHSPTMGCHNIRPLYTALPKQPEQEPYGYLWFTHHMERRFTHYKPKEEQRIGDVMPVYTAPPQREWQSLTDDDFSGLTTQQIFAMKFAEARLKDKNA